MLNIRNVGIDNGFTGSCRFSSGSLKNRGNCKLLKANIVLHGVPPLAAPLKDFADHWNRWSSPFLQLFAKCWPDWSGWKQEKIAKSCFCQPGNNLFVSFSPLVSLVLSHLVTYWILIGCHSHKMLFLTWLILSQAVCSCVICILGGSPYSRRKWCYFRSSTSAATYTLKGLQR